MIYCIKGGHPGYGTMRSVWFLLSYRANDKINLAPLPKLVQLGKALHCKLPEAAGLDQLVNPIRDRRYLAQQILFDRRTEGIPMLISQCAFKRVQVVTDRHRLPRMLGTDTLIGCDGSYCSKVGLGVNADFLESTRNGRTDVPKLFDRQVW